MYSHIHDTHEHEPMCMLDPSNNCTLCQASNKHIIARIHDLLNLRDRVADGMRLYLIETLIQIAHTINSY